MSMRALVCRVMDQKDAHMGTAMRSRMPVAPAILAGASAYTVAAYLAWLGWDQEKTRIPGSSDLEGPYEAWQVLGLALSLAGLAGLLTWRRTSWGSLCAVAVVVTLTVAWSIDAAGQTSIGANLWPIGAAFLLVGSAVGLGLVVAVTSGLRHVVRRSTRLLAREN